MIDKIYKAIKNSAVREYETRGILGCVACIFTLIANIMAWMIGIYFMYYGHITYHTHPELTITIPAGLYLIGFGVLLIILYPSTFRVFKYPRTKNNDDEKT